MVKVFGHLSPDTDATCSAIVWAWYLNEHTAHEATPFVLGELNTDSPIDITIRPLACTATIQYDLMMQAGVTIPANIAGLMMSAILSDTLGFRSPTTTPHDKDVGDLNPSVSERMA